MVEWCIIWFMDLKIEKAVEVMNFYDEQVHTVDDLGGMLAGKRKEATSDFWSSLQLRESILKQKLRVNWMNEVDSNTRFFIRVTKEGVRRNNLVGIDLPYGIIETVEGVKGEVKHYFEAKYKESTIRRTMFDGIDFNTLSIGEAEELENQFSLEDVKEAVWSCDGDKCPGLDGYNFSFLKKCWEVFSMDIFNFVSEFHCKADLPKAITTYFFGINIEG